MEKNSAVFGICAWRKKRLPAGKVTGCGRFVHGKNTGSNSGQRVQTPCHVSP
jgi:hypothetical protein